MLQMYAGSSIIVGVTRENVKRLTDGKPMRVQLMKQVTDVLILFGETKPDILREVEKAGIEIAQVIKDEAERDPL